MQPRIAAFEQCRDRRPFRDRERGLVQPRRLTLGR